MRVGHHLQVGPAQVRRQVGLGGAAALAALLRHLVQAHAFLQRAVEVAVQRVAGLLRGLHEELGRARRLLQVHHVQRAARAMEGVAAAFVVLGLQEVGQHVLPGPARVALGGPMVVVLVLAADIDHRVDRTGPAQPSAARLVTQPAVQPGLRHRIEGPVDLTVRLADRETDRAMDQHALVDGAGLEQQHLRLRVFAEPCGQHAAGRAAADDDVVVHACLLVGPGMVAVRLWGN